MKTRKFKAWGLFSKRGDLQSTETEPLLFLTRRSAEEWLPDSRWLSLEDAEVIQRVTVTVEPIKKPKRAKLLDKNPYPNEECKNCLRNMRSGCELQQEWNRKKAGL